MNSMRQRWKWLVLMLILVVPAIWSCRIPLFQKNLKAETQFGRIMGTSNERALMFLGVPFAAPPVGELRWKAPEDPKPWRGVLQAKKSRDVCIQAEMTNTWHATGDYIGSEDCLYLDIYRPKNYRQDLPVYVYFHGGANRFGGAASYDGSYLAQDQNVIVVIAQYRLGPLGWLSHPALRTGDPADAEDDSGNFGTLDNIKALQWVQNNIANFGGDPANVTIGGQSAGASNVAKLLISPLAGGLFKGAVLQSLGGSIITPAAGEALASAMLSKLSGYDQIDPADSAAVEAFLRGKTAEELIAAHGTTYAGFSDGTVLPGSYVEVIYNDDHNAVPVLLGSTEYEWKNFMPLYAPYPSPIGYGKPLWSKVYDLFDPDFDPDREWTFDEIFASPDEIALYEAIGKYRSLGWKFKAVDELATLLQTRQDDVYAFFFKWGGTESASPEFAHVFGAAHAMDIPFFFGYDHDLFGYALTPENRPGFQDLQDIMMAYLGNFIRTGDPGTVAGATWSQWSNDLSEDAPKCMVFDADFTSAQFGMDSATVTPEGLRAAAEEEVADFAEGDAALVLAMLASYQREYFLNDEGYDILLTALRFDPLPGAQAYYGVNKDAGYQIEIPEGWQDGRRDLVMYAHGYRGEVPELTVTQPGRLRHYLTSQGFAWAASSYTANGYNIVSGVQSTDDLLAYFKEQFGEPDNVYIVGHSMGGHITARTITDPKYKDNYVGALPMCGVVGGGVDLFSYFLDWGLLANYYARLNFPVPMSDSLLADFQTAIFGPGNDGDGVLGYLPPQGYFGALGIMADLEPAGEALKTATMYRSGGKRPLYDTAFSRWATFAIQGQSLSWLADPTSGLGINVVGNASRDYHLDDDFAAISEPEDLLNKGIQRVNDPIYDFEAEMYPVSGHIDIPVLTLHTIGDLFVPFSMEQLWAQRIADAGNSDRFSARAIRSGSHCAFTVEEEVQAFAELVAWVDYGIKPIGDKILEPDVVAADDFGCQFTKIVNPAYGDDPTRYLDDPDFAAVCSD